MKRHLGILIMSASLTALAPGAIVITEVMSVSGHGGGAGNGDWFEIYNSGSSAVDLTGWSWDDDSDTPGTHNFGGASISAGGTLLFVDENATLLPFWTNDVWGLTGSADLVVLGNAGSGFSGFGGSGDTIHVYDASDAEQATVTFGSATSGSSFEWDSAGNSLGVSILGENGAFQALLDGDDGAADDDPSAYGAGSDFASPGSVVIVPPPPASCYSRSVSWRVSAAGA